MASINKRTKVVTFAPDSKSFSTSLAYESATEANLEDGTEVSSDNFESVDHRRKRKHPYVIATVVSTFQVVAAKVKNACVEVKRAVLDFTQPERYLTKKHKSKMFYERERRRRRRLASSSDIETEATAI